MSVDRRISIATIKNELEKCHEHCEIHSWIISEINEINLTFTVVMASPIDKENYLIEIQFDDYPQIPPLIEFIDPNTGQKGSKYAYPDNKRRGNGIGDSFFHPMPCICNPCSRKSYKSYSQNAPHGDWKYDNWQENPKTGNLKTMNRILSTIYFRISSKKYYKGRML
jgi:hypothetical protein